MMKYVKLILVVTASLISTLIGGFLFYQFITVGLGIEVFLLGSIYVITSIICFLLPLDYKLFKVSKYFRGIVMWLLLMFATVFLVTSYNFIRNLSRDVFVAEFYSNSGLELHLRENGTYKAVNEDWMSGYVSYGKYKLEGNNIIIMDNDLKLGSSIVIDTLRYNGSQVSFRLKNDWKGIKTGNMSVKLNELF